jgi:uncharacterized protein YjiS (DUF1127 family)
MTREFSHEYGVRSYVATAHDERAQALTRAGFVVISGADRALRRTVQLLTAGAASLARGWQRYGERRTTYRELAKLDDRLLRDIGLTRADIDGSAGDLSQLEAAVGAAVQQPAVKPVALHDLKRAA